MKRILTLLSALCLLLTLSVPAFADVLPPSTFSVTVGDTPVRRYTMQYQNGEPVSLTEDGVIPGGQRIDIIDIAAINGKRYGLYQQFDRSVDPETDLPGNFLGGWKTYYFLLEDVLSPAEAATAQSAWDNEASWSVPVLTTAAPETATTAAPETTTAVPETTTAVPSSAVTQPETTETTTPAQTSETDAGDTTAQTENSAAETDTTVPGRAAPAQRSTRSVLLLCVGAAVVLALSSVVTLTLIRRKRAQNH